MQFYLTGAIHMARTGDGVNTYPVMFDNMFAVFWFKLKSLILYISCWL